MAEIKVTHPDVARAESNFYGYMAEAQAFAQLAQQTQDDSPFATLAPNIIDRLCAAFDSYHMELLRHGVPALDDRLPHGLDA